MKETPQKTSSNEEGYSVEFSENDIDMVIYRMIGNIGARLLGNL